MWKTTIKAPAPFDSLCESWALLNTGFGGLVILSWKRKGIKNMWWSQQVSVGTASSSFEGSPQLVTQTVKTLPAVQETWVQSLDWEYPLEEGMATHSSILAWRIPRTEEPSGLQSMGSRRVRHDWAHTPSGDLEYNRYRSLQNEWIPVLKASIILVVKT